MDTVELTGFGGLSIMADRFGSPEDPPVLLLPSAGQTREYWHGAAAALAEAGRYALCVDLRGHGDSGVAPDGRYDLDAHVSDLRAVLAAMPMRAVIVAAGLGALVAIVAVGESDAPMVSAMVLTDAAVTFDPTAAERMGGALARRAGPFADEDALLRELATAHPDEPAPTATAPLLAAFARRDDGSYLWRGDPRALGGGRPLEQQDRLRAAAAAIAVPVALLRGALNDSISREVTADLHSVLRDGEVLEIEGVGHHSAVDREDAFHASLLDFLERRNPRTPLTYLGGAEPRMLRDALGCFGTGVTVVTSFDANGEPIGLTANSFTSVSLDPPLILFSLVKASGSLPALVAAGRFAVNVLHIGQQPVANRFARRDQSRFEGVDWGVLSEGGSPIVAGSLASFDCETWATHDGGDHLIFIGRVHHAWYEPHRDPLLYFRGRYRRLHFA